MSNNGNARSFFELQGISKEEADLFETVFRRERLLKAIIGILIMVITVLLSAIVALIQ